MRFIPKKLAGTGYIVLNVVRGLNIIALLAVIAASSVMLVKTFIVSKFFFFDACEHVIRVVISGFLILTELSVLKSWIAKYWPLFSPRASFVMLGVGMIFLGNSILGNLNKQATSQQSLGLPFWRLVIASGIIVFVMGFVNLCTSFIFADRKAHLTARQVRSHGATASQKADVDSYTPKPPSRKSHYRSFFLGGKRDTLPSYTSSKKSNMAETPKMHLAISSPFPQSQSLTRTAQSPGGASSKYSQSPKSERYFHSSEINRPDLAHHPAVMHGQAI